MLTRRRFLQTLAGASLVGAALGAYSVVIEPFWRLRVTRYALSPPGWPDGLALRLAVVADVHACRPWMEADRIARIADLTNSLNADAILLLGDYTHAMRRLASPEDPKKWAGALARLKAPLGVHAVLGNHDWWDDEAAMRAALTDRTVLPYAGHALQDVGVKVYSNDATRLTKDGRAFWIAGLCDQIALAPFLWNTPKKDGLDDLPATLAKVADDAPVVLMAHEPDIFVEVPNRVALTVSGHTHGGQVNLFGWRPIVPSRYGSRFAYGHIVEDERHLIVSGGLGETSLPIRFNSPPEVVLIDLGAAAG